MENQDKKKSLTRRLLGYAVRWLLPLVLTILLVSYMFRKVNFSDMWQIVTHGVDYWWILCAMGISVFSHIFRAMRWGLQLRALGIRPPFMALCCSIFGTYALNLVFPRLGEVWRCTYISSLERKPLTTVMGTMVGDRICDTITVLVLTLLAFIIATPQIEAFMQQYSVGRSLMATASNPWLWVALAGTVAICWIFLHCWRNTRPVRKVRQWIGEAWSGVSIVAKMPGRWQFFLLTIAIWGCYFIQLYVAFFAFDFTRDLCRPELAFGLVPCLVAFVLSSLGMAIPSNGGLGPWNIAVMFGLSLYGISDAQGTAFSMLQWSGQTVMIIILGIFTMAYIALHPKDKAAEARAKAETEASMD